MTEAAVRETHVSVLFFVGDRVFKLKKPVTTGFLDFSTREARLAACRREVELNRRLAPDVYLGVADVVGPDGAPCDHLVVMRRMPDSRRLAALLAVGEDLELPLRSIARLLAAFHEAAAVVVPASVRANWQANIDEMVPFVGPVLDPDVTARVALLALRYLEGRAPLLEARRRDRRVRDCHGDLQAEDIFCLEDGPRVLDCIEFDDRLRHIDVLDDVAFLVMDLERLGAPEAGERLLALYREFSGDAFPASLAHHFVAYRAHVRAKVACLRHLQGDPSAAAAAADLMAIACSHLETARVRLVLVGGLPGTGKSTLAAAMNERRGWLVVRSDEVRKELAGIPLDRPAGAAYGHGIYTPEMTAATYQEMLRRADVALGLGETVVLDASFLDARWQRAAAEVARRTAADLVEIRCVAPAPLAAARLRTRRGDASDAMPLEAAAMAATAHPWPGAVLVDTSVCVEKALAVTLTAAGP